MIAADIGGSHISSIAIKNIESGEVIGNLHTHHMSVSEYDQRGILDLWAQNLKECIDTTDHFDGSIAIAFPGPFQYTQGIVFPHINAKFKPIEGLNLKAELKSRLKNCKHIFFENDAACFGIGEYYYGHHPKQKKIVAITLGSGIGSSFVNEGIPITDGNQVPKGGEVYHLPFQDSTADDYFSTRWFVNAALDHGIKVGGVRELITDCRPEITQTIFDEFTNQLYQFLAPIVHDFEATTIVFGGNISKAWPYFGAQMEYNFNKDGITIRQSILGEKGICLGAARSFYNNISHEDSNLS